MTSTHLDDSELVYSALTLFANSTRGEKPDWQDLEEFRARSLPPERSAEVLSHVANDPDCFQQWLDLSEASLWLDAEEQGVDADSVAEPAVETKSDVLPARTRPSEPTVTGAVTRWLQSLLTLPAPVYAGAMAAVLVAVLVVPLLQSPDVQNLSAGVDRTLDSYRALSGTAAVDAPIRRSTRRMDGLVETLPLATVERMYFEQGLQTSLGRLLDSPTSAWRDWSGSLHTDTPDCAASADVRACQDIAEDARTLGEWTLITWFACRQPVMVDSGSFWDEQIELYQAFRARDSLRESASFADAFSVSRPDDAVSLCKAVESLMSVSR